MFKKFKGRKKPRTRIGGNLSKALGFGTQLKLQQQFGVQTSFLQVYRGLGKGGHSGYGLDRFRDVLDAHASIDEMIEEFGLDDEGCEYPSIDGYANPYTQAYEEEYERAEELAAALSLFDIEIQPEDLIEWDRVEEMAYEYADELACAWYDGDEWVPAEIMDWAWYDLSGHNG